MADTTYTQVLHSLLEIAVQESASDLHLSPGSHPLVRIEGVLTPIEGHPVLDSTDTRAMLAAMIGDARLAEFDAALEADFSYSLDDGSRFRGNAFYASGSVCITLRYVSSVIRTLEELDLPPILDTFTQRKQGLFLCVGAIGQGKTTTLAAMIDKINETRNVHIVTVEDPVEYVYTSKKAFINQREVHFDTLDFPTALRAALRQDINVLLVGEMRGLASTSTAVTAAETGHLVFSTMHTNNAAQTVDRIIDSFPSNQQDQIRLQLSSSLAGILSQRLVPGVDGKRVPVCELLINTPAVSNLIRERRTHELRTAIETGVEYGMIDMNRSLMERVQQGKITMETAYAYSQDPKGLERLL